MTRRRAGEEMRESKLGWIGDIPADWSLVPTKQVLKLVKRTVGDRWADHQLLSLTKQGVIARNMESNHGKFPESFDTYQAVLPGELIFCLFDVDETPRTVGLATQSGMVTGAYDCFQTNPTLDHRFASWYFIAINDGKRFRPLYSGLRKVVPKPRFLSAGFALPSLKEQRQIADYLDVHTAKIDALIGKQEQLIEMLAERRQAVISHAVTKGLDPNAPMKDSGVDWLGEVPTSWLISALKRAITSQSSGTSVNGINTPADGDELGVLKTSSVSTGVFDPSENKTVLTEDLGRVTCRVIEGAILVNRANSPERVGAAAVVRGSYPNLYLSDKLWQLLLNQVDSIWLYWWLQTATYRDQVRALRVGPSSSMQNLSYQDFREIRIAVPPLKEQQEIAAVVDRETAQIDALSAKAREMIDVLKERRQALISAAVTGKIDVRGLA